MDDIYCKVWGRWGAGAGLVTNLAQSTATLSGSSVEVFIEDCLQLVGFFVCSQSLSLSHTHKGREVLRLGQKF